MKDSKLKDGLKQALAVASGDEPAGRITINGHAYVPEVSTDPDIRHVIQLLEEIARRTKPGNRHMDQMIRDMDLANSHAETALKVMRD